jgi:Fe-S cluster assembly protein SufD
MALPKAKEDALAARLAGLPQSFGRGWLSVARGEALARLTATGLPARRDEYWRYTDPASLNAAEAPFARRFDARDEASPFDGMDRLKIVFVDGVFDAAASDDLTLSGVTIERLAVAGGTDIHWAQGTYGMLEARGQSPVARPFAALNTAFASDGVLIHVTGRAAKPVSLIYVHNSETSDAILHNCVKLEAGAELTLLENGPAAARLSKVLEVEIADRARFHHIRLQGRDHDRRAVTHVFARLGSQSEMRSFTLTANGRLTRNETVVELAGAESRVHLAGATVGDGEFHHDDTVFVTHAAPACESRQVFKKVLMNGATGVFQGKILVRQGAQKTDGYQISQCLLLDGDSQFLAKPELEIYADDVKCSHGSTSGAIDETALFYLQSRGVPRRTAQALLVLAFLAEAIDEIADATIAEDIRARLERWLARHGSKGAA